MGNWRCPLAAIFLTDQISFSYFVDSHTLAISAISFAVICGVYL